MTSFNSDPSHSRYPYSDSAESSQSRKRFVPPKLEKEVNLVDGTTGQTFFDTSGMS